MLTGRSCRSIELAGFIEERLLPGAGIADHEFRAAADIFERFVPRNRALLTRRDEIQAEIDDLAQGDRPAV